MAGAGDEEGLNPHKASPSLPPGALAPSATSEPDTPWAAQQAGQLLEEAQQRALQMAIGSRPTSPDYVLDCSPPNTHHQAPSLTSAGGGKRILDDACGALLLAEATEDPAASSAASVWASQALGALAKQRQSGCARKLGEPLTGEAILKALGVAMRSPTASQGRASRPGSRATLRGKAKEQEAATRSEPVAQACGSRHHFAQPRKPGALRYSRSVPALDMTRVQVGDDDDEEDDDVFRFGSRCRASGRDGAGLDPATMGVPQLNFAAVSSSGTPSAMAQRGKKGGPFKELAPATASQLPAVGASREVTREGGMDIGASAQTQDAERPPSRGKQDMVSRGHMDFWIGVRSRRATMGEELEAQVASSGGSADWRPRAATAPIEMYVPPSSRSLLANGSLATCGVAASSFATAAAGQGSWQQSKCPQRSGPNGRRTGNKAILRLPPVDEASRIAVLHTHFHHHYHLFAPAEQPTTASFDAGANAESVAPSGPGTPGVANAGQKPAADCAEEAASDRSSLGVAQSACALDTQVSSLPVAAQ